jgi:hypothetical protein
MLCEEEVFGTPHSMRRGNSSGPHSFGSGASAGYSMRQTGSGPQLPSGSTSVPALPPSLRVPPTMVAPIPSYIAQLTPHPMAASTTPSMQGSKPSRAPLVIGLLVVVFGLAASGAYFARTRSASTPLTTSGTGTAPAGAGSGAAAGNGPSGAAGAEAAFTLTIVSAPPGATVSEGENALGETPVTIAVDRASVSAAPRTFVITKEGFAPSHVVQGPSYENVRSVVSLAPAVALAPDGSSAVKSRPPSGGKPATVAAGTPPAKPPATAVGPATGPGTDIRLKR